jgi:hypothetical protein
MLKLPYVGDKCLNLSKKVTKSFLYDDTGRSTGPKKSIFGFLPIKSFCKEISEIFCTPTNNGFFSGTMASEIRLKVYLLKIDEIYTFADFGIFSVLLKSFPALVSKTFHTKISFSQSIETWYYGLAFSISDLVFDAQCALHTCAKFRYHKILTISPSKKYY